MDDSNPVPEKIDPQNRFTAACRLDVVFEVRKILILARTILDFDDRENCQIAS